ncbi:MAG: hypothetical protein ACKPJD_04170, partial [Planctomycetaceae bacterium]
MTTTEQNQNSEAKTGCAEPAGAGQHPDAAALGTLNLRILAEMKVLLPAAANPADPDCPGFV